MAIFPMARILFGNLLSGPATRPYPRKVRPDIAGSRGRITIDYSQCIHCGACARRCPARAIAVAKDPKSWSIDRFACVTCGLCVRICPKKCLFLETSRPNPALAEDRQNRIEEHRQPEQGEKNA